MCLQVTFYHLCTLTAYVILVFGRDRSFCIGRARACGETSTTLAETQSSVSSVGVQCKGSFILFLVIKMLLFPASVWKKMTAVNSFRSKFQL